MGLQLGSNFAGITLLFYVLFADCIIAGPYAGLIPDSVHPAQIGKASGYDAAYSSFSTSF